MIIINNIKIETDPNIVDMVDYVYSINITIAIFNDLYHFNKYSKNFEIALFSKWFKDYREMHRFPIKS